MAKKLIFLLFVNITVFSMFAMDVAFGKEKYSTQPLTMKLNSAERREFENELAKVSKGKIPTGANGGIICDCVITKKFPLDKYGQPKWLATVNRFYLGSEMIKGNAITLSSPAVKNGGVNLRLGKRYRIFCVESPDKLGLYMVWRGCTLLLNHAKADTSHKNISE